MKTRLTAILLIACITIPLASRAASQDECAIWLCLPVGFAVPGCGAAHGAMIKRMFEFKSPVPSFGSCVVQSEQTPNTGNFTMSRGQAALMGSYYNGNQWIRPVRLIVPGFCNHRDSGHEEPRGCLSTVQSIKLYENGVQMGMTYYRNKRGRDYVEIPSTGDIYPANAVPPEAIQQVYGPQ